MGCGTAGPPILLAAGPPRAAPVRDRPNAHGGLARELQVGEARQHRLASDTGVLERDGDLLVVPSELRGDDDAVAPLRVVDPVPVAVPPLTGNDRPRRNDARLTRPEARCNPACRGWIGDAAPGIVPGWQSPAWHRHDRPLARRLPAERA